ncbi:MAG TPA: hypothetical protein VGW78_03545 [Candidatus Babeliales bacterium]|jgi:hypothetical protein|nr:hypothetical protein [Candidatus Babeliales bacterium]
MLHSIALALGLVNNQPDIAHQHAAQIANQAREHQAKILKGAYDHKRLLTQEEKIAVVLSQQVQEDIATLFVENPDIRQSYIRK